MAITSHSMTALMDNGLFQIVTVNALISSFNNILWILVTRLVRNQQSHYIVVVVDSKYKYQL